MKVAILTFKFHSNFGFIMQAYALQQAIKRLGHDPYTFDLRNEQVPLHIKVKTSIKNAYLRIFKNQNVPIFKYWPTQDDFDIIDKNTYAFINDNIQLTPYIKNIKELYSIDNSEYGAFIVGSDQVWRARFSPKISSYFFDFVSDNRPRMAYAASFGTSDIDYRKNELKECAKLIQKFEKVTVREADGVTICKKYFNINAQHVLDPTFLVDKEHYERLADKSEVINEGKPYIFTYILEPGNSQLMKFVKEKSHELNLPVVNMLPKNYINSNKKEIRNLVYPSIYKLLRGFRDADYVITDSFHGTAFSIILNKEFSVFLNGHGNSRIYSILSYFNISSRLIDDNYNPEILNWHDINAKIQEKQKESFEILGDFLNISK